jgi:hypothetical protein
MTGRENIDPAAQASGPADVNDDDLPLDPAVERVRRKLVRLLVGSFGIMILGLIAVFSTIVYRLSSNPASDPSSDRASTVSEADPAGAMPASVDVLLPGGARVVSTSISGPRTLLHIEVPGEEHGQLIIMETDTGKIVGRFRLQEISGNGPQ